MSNEQQIEVEIPTSSSTVILKEGSFTIVKVDVPNSKLRSVMHTLKEAKNNTGIKVSVVVTNRDMDVKDFDEETMRRLGWERIK